MSSLHSKVLFQRQLRTVDLAAAMSIDVPQMRFPRLCIMDVYASLVLSG